MAVSFVSNMQRNYTSGWYAYQLHKLNENLEKLHTYFPNKREISGLDILNYIVYEAQYPTDLKSITTNIDNILIWLNKLIKTGRWLLPHGVSVTSMKTSGILNYLTSPIDLERILMVIYETLEDKYFRFYDPDIEQYRVNLEKKYDLEPPPILLKHYSIDDTANIHKLIKDLIPYSNQLEHIHKDVINELRHDILTPLLSIKDSI